VQLTERTPMGGFHSIQTQTNGVLNVGTTIEPKAILKTISGAATTAST
jgi:heterodisulfide reductase subunit A-like polyferredoxin